MSYDVDQGLVDSFKPEVYSELVKIFMLKKFDYNKNKINKNNLIKNKIILLIIQINIFIIHYYLYLNFTKYKHIQRFHFLQ